MTNKSLRTGIVQRECRGVGIISVSDNGPRVVMIDLREGHIVAIEIKHPAARTKKDLIPCNLVLITKLYNRAATH